MESAHIYEMNGTKVKKFKQYNPGSCEVPQRNSKMEVSDPRNAIHGSDARGRESSHLPKAKKKMLQTLDGFKTGLDSNKNKYVEKNG